MFQSVDLRQNDNFSVGSMELKLGKCADINSVQTDLPQSDAEASAPPRWCNPERGKFKNNSQKKEKPANLQT